MGDNGFAENLMVIETNMVNTRRLLREATAELNRRQSIIDDYRRKNYAHEDMVGNLLELLKNDDLDAARDIVSREYDSIHGPRD